MRAAVYDRYGPPEVVSVRDLPKPEPRDGDVLVRVRATTVSAADWRARSLELPPGFGPLGRLVFGVRRPRRRILGTEAAGVIEAVGRAVHAFQPGDEVIIYPGIGLGCHAEYRAIAADGKIIRKPASLSMEQAAALCFGGLTALHFLTKGNVQAGERVLVNGASGAVGSAVVQLARHMGAHVTAVCSGANAELVRSIGAHDVIDYTREDFADGRATWDVVVDCAGTAPFARVKPVLPKGGRLLQVVGDLYDVLRLPWVALTSDRKVIGGGAPERPKDMQTLADLADAGKYRPLIDSVHPLDAIVEAHRRADSGRKRGSAVVAVD